MIYSYHHAPQVAPGLLQLIKIIFISWNKMNAIGIVHPKIKKMLKISLSIQDVDELVSSSEQTWRK